MALDERTGRAVIQGVALTRSSRPTRSTSVRSPVGITADAMAPAQRDMLMKSSTPTSRRWRRYRRQRTAKLRKAGLEKIAFAWAGDAERGKKHYYRIQGPTFLIEHDNSQNDGNHIHSIWRDFNGDFGRDLLREHIAKAH
jgi:hypothetical protein